MLPTSRSQCDCSVDDNIFGESGHDVIFSGPGNDMVLGGSGNDFLHGGLGRDLLIGGAGRDLIVGSSGDDLLIGGSTTFDSDDASLTLIRREWTSDRSFENRVHNLRYAEGPILDGTGIRLELGTTIDDDERDLLFGSLGEDWLLDDSDETSH